MKIVQFGLHYSPNVGDGIISETLGHAIAALRPGADYVTVDISGRSGFGATTVRNRALALAVLGVLPALVRGRLVEARLTRMLDAAEPGWRAALAGADLAVLGGGQIFSDADLNFCTKIARVATLACDTGTPLAVHAAGVSGNWSARGTELFGGLFRADLRAVGLRDQLSVDNWVRQTNAQGPAPHLTRDPGLLAAECYGPASAPGEAIALCVTDPRLLHYHADGGVAGAGQDGHGFFRDLAQELVRRGHSVRLFCNGADEDRAALTRVAGLLNADATPAGDRITVAPPPDTPSDLAGIISGSKAVIAHRMHACIVAYSYRIPTVGLGWDRKLESFFASVGQADGFVSAGEDAISRAADAVGDRLSAGIDADTHAQVLNETRDAVSGLLSRV